MSFANTIQLWKVIEGLKEIPKNKMVFDGRCNAYAAKELKVDKFVQKVELPDEHPMPKKDSSKKAKANEFVVKITCVARIELEELHRFLRREGPITPGCFTAIQGKSSRRLLRIHSIFWNYAHINIIHSSSIEHCNDAQVVQ